MQDFVDLRIKKKLFFQDKNLVRDSKRFYFRTKISLN